MIKHAAKNDPLISGKERIDLAITKVIGDKTLTTQQQKWLELIKKHLIENLTIEPEDFNIMPIFVSYGGSFDRVNRDFDNNLMAYISKLNAAIPEVYAYAPN